MNVLVLCAHPDDETLGCGGTMLRHVAAGDTVTWAIATQAHEPQWSAETIARKADEVDAVAAEYGVARHVKLRFPTTLLETLPRGELIAAYHSLIEEVRPDLVYLVHPGDVHGDHRVVYESAMVVLKAFRMRALGVRQVVVYETLSSTDAAAAHAGTPFVPNVFRDIGAYIERKVEIMALYVSEAQRDPLPRGPGAIRALARFRGATVGIDYAEAFCLVRDVD